MVYALVLIAKKASSEGGKTQQRYSVRAVVDAEALPHACGEKKKQQ
jgi:hypothetical protein